MSEQLEAVVDNKHSEEKTKEQILNQKFSIEGYNVAIFYTKKTPKVDTEEGAKEDDTEKAPKERYITIKITNEKTGAVENLDPIKMVDVSEMDEDIGLNSEIDVEDVNHALRAVDLYLYEQRHRNIDHILAKLSLAA